MQSPKPRWMFDRDDLNKATTAADFSPTDYHPELRIASAQTIDNQYRVPEGRWNGNVVFRRYPDNSLDFNAAKNIVIDCIHKVKDEGILDNLEMTILSVVFPDTFQFIDPMIATQMARVNLRLTADEIRTIGELVSAHLKEELNWNAGAGGGSVPGRSVTRS